MSNPLHDEMLREAVEAVRTGDRDKARKILEEVLQEDEENHHAWLFLARLADNPDEKRIGLTTVLQLDPGNKQARKLLDKLDANVKTKAEKEVIAGISRRMFNLLVGGTVAFVVFTMVGVVALALSNSASENRKRADATAAALNATQIQQQFTQGAIQAITAEFNLTLTQFAINSPTPTPSPTRSVGTLPPTFTPEPTLDLRRPTSLPTPSGLSGSIIAWSGRDVLNSGYLEIKAFSLNGSDVRDISTDFTRYPSSHDGQRVVYTRYSRTSFRQWLELRDIESGATEDLSARWQGLDTINNPDMAHLSSNGTRVVFVGTSPSTNSTEVFLLALGSVTTGEPALIRLTNDSANYSHPALSPDGSHVAVIRNLPGGEVPGPDVVVINVRNRTQLSLTNDGSATVESLPTWSPDGRSVAYAAATAAQPRNRDIYVVAVDGSGLSFTAVASPADDAFPVYSPDGRYLVFASNRAQTYDLFVYEFSTQTTFQLTDTIDDDYPGSWVTSE